MRDFLDYMKNDRKKAENTLIAYERDLKAFEKFLKDRGPKGLEACNESDAISYVLEAFEHIRAVRYAFWGIRAGVLALILRALWSLFRQCRKGAFAYALMLLSFAAVACFGVSAIAVILCCALLGIAHGQIGGLRA